MDKDIDEVKHELQRLRANNIHCEGLIGNLQKNKRCMQTAVSNQQRDINETLSAQTARKQAVENLANNCVEFLSKNDELRSESRAVIAMLERIDHNTLCEQVHNIEQTLTSLQNFDTLNATLKSTQKKFDNTEKEIRQEITTQDIIWKERLLDLENQILDVKSCLQEQDLQSLNIKHKVLQQEIKNNELESASIKESITELDNKFEKAQTKYQELTSAINNKNTGHSDGFKNIQQALCEMTAKVKLHSEQLQVLQKTQTDQRDQHLQIDVRTVEQEQFLLNLQYKINCSNLQALLGKRPDVLKGVEEELGPGSWKDLEDINKITECIKDEVNKIVSKKTEMEFISKNYDDNLRNMLQKKQMLLTSISEMTENTKIIQTGYELANVEFQELESTFRKQSGEQLEEEKRMQAEVDKLSVEIQEITCVDKDVEEQMNHVLKQQALISEQTETMKSKLLTLLKETDKMDETNKDLDKINDDLSYELRKIENQIALLTKQQKRKDKKRKLKSSSLPLADWLEEYYKKRKSN